MKKTAFRNLVISFFRPHFFITFLCQRWVPEDDFNHIKTFNNVLEKTIKEISLINLRIKMVKSIFQTNNMIKLSAYILDTLSAQDHY